LRRKAVDARLVSIVSLVTMLATLSACSGTTYVHLAPVQAPDGPALAAPTSWQAPGPGSASLVVDAIAGGASVVELFESAPAQTICAQTPCSAEVPPGRHRYRLVPARGGMVGQTASKDSIYATAVDADVVLEAGETRVLRASLGRTEVHRSFPVGRGIAWALLGVGAAVAVAGVAGVGSSPNNSPAQGYNEGIAYFGLSGMFFGASLWLGNAKDNETIVDRPGTFRF
jgi:hypothetical protein